jgi:hypothetical protein
MTGSLEAVIAAGAALGVIAPALVVLIAFVLARFHFGGYVRRKHPKVWRDLVLGADRTALLALRPAFDATPELAEFRVVSIDDLADPELAVRRKLANRAERLCMISFLGGVGWMVIAAAAIVVLRTR